MRSRLKLGKKKILKDIKETIEKNYENPLDDLVVYLENEIDKEAGY
jgi:hypothetical protein